MKPAVMIVASAVEVWAAHDDCGSRRHDNRRGPTLPSCRAAPAVAAAPTIAADIPARALPAARIPTVGTAAIDVLHGVDDRHRLGRRANRAGGGRQRRRL